MPPLAGGVSGQVVISTNLAETSITIDDIVYVIDAGLVKEKQYALPCSLSQSPIR